LAGRAAIRPRPYDPFGKVSQDEHGGPLIRINASSQYAHERNQERQYFEDQ
jgi:hypothetical protein